MLKRRCRSAEAFVSLESVGLPQEYDDRIRKAEQAERIDESYDEFLQHMLWDVRCNYSGKLGVCIDVSNEAYGNIFSYDEFKAIIQALINYNFVIQDSPLEIIQALLSNTVLGNLGIIDDDFVYAKGEFFDWCYEHVYRGSCRLDTNLLWREIQATLPYDQYLLVKQVWEHGYTVENCHDDIRVFYDIEHRSCVRELMTRQYDELWEYIYEKLSNWEKNQNFYSILQAALDY